MTKIELLVVGLIIGLLGIMAVVAVASARSGMRDAVRLGNIRDFQTGLELYFNDTNSYPESESPVALGQSSTRCLGKSGFSSSCSDGTVYLDVVASIPTGGLEGFSSCESYSDAYCYSAAETAYRIQFELERANALLELQKGLNCATEQGIVAGTCSSLSQSLDSEQ